jgi:hypothetical protein
MTSNTGLFRRYAQVEEQMIRGAMPQTSAKDLAPLADGRVREVIAGRTGSRLVKVLTASVAERMVANG